MSDFFKRNLLWITILLCTAGIVLSIIGIPMGKPIFFFVGVILALPTITYLIYQVFFDAGKPEINLAPATIKINHSNITSIINDKNQILITENISNEEDLESFYHGYANQDEITKRLHEVTNNERERTIIELPEIALPEADPHGPDEEYYDEEFDSTTAIETATNQELILQRETSQPNFELEIPTDDITNKNFELSNQLIEDDNTQKDNITPTVNFAENITSNYTLTLTDPNFVPGERVMPKLDPKLINTKHTIIRLNPKNAEIRKQKAQEKKALLSQPNLEQYLQRYFIETAACFLMDRTIYKDKHGIAPYNKYAVNKDTGLLEYSMSPTKGRLYKFCTYLIDAERFITHTDLYEDFITAVERGISLARISETLHPLYRKKYKKDFILNLSNREDWDNVMILVYNNYILNNDNFKDVFIRVPFEIPVAYNEPNIIDYLKDPDIQESFNERYTAIEDIGIPTYWEAIYICFINSIKQKLNILQLENALLREYKKVSRGLKRADKLRRKKVS